MSTQVSGQQPEEKRPYYEIRSLRRALRVLDVFLQSSEQPQTLGDLEERTGLPKATVFRMVNTLCAAGYLVPAGTDAYGVGKTLVEFRQAASRSFTELQWKSVPAIEDLVEKTGETAYVGVLNRGDVVTAYVKEGNHTLRMYSWIGKRRPAHCSAMGKAMLAFRSREYVRTFLDYHELTALTPKTITDPGAFMQHLDEVQRQGWALDDEEAELELRCVAAPIFDRFGEVCAAVSLSGPAWRIGTGARLQEVAVHVRQAAQGISRMLGFWPVAPTQQEGRTVGR